MLMNVNGGPTSFWDLVLSKLGHRFSGKLGNYDAVRDNVRVYDVGLYVAKIQSYSVDFNSGK